MRLNIYQIRDIIDILDIIDISEPKNKLDAYNLFQSLKHIKRMPFNRDEIDSATVATLLNLNVVVENQKQFLSNAEETDISEKFVGQLLVGLLEIEQIGFPDLTINKRCNCDRGGPVRPPISLPLFASNGLSHPCASFPSSDG